MGTAPPYSNSLNRAAVKVLIYLYYDYYSAVTEWGSTQGLGAEYPSAKKVNLLNYGRLF